MRCARTCSSGSGAALMAVGVFVTAGCIDRTVPAEDFRNVERQLVTAKERITALETEIAAQQKTISDLAGQIHTLRGVEGNPADVLIVPERIKLASMSGGYNEDGEAGDDGLVLYVQPIDRDGDVVKAAGTIKVRLLDPQNPPDDLVIADYYFDGSKTRSLWYGRFLTHHFRVWCPWPREGPPAHREVTAYVVFTGLITGRSLTTTGTYEVTLPPRRTDNP